MLLSELWSLVGMKKKEAEQVVKSKGWEGLVDMEVVDGVVESVAWLGRGKEEKKKLA